jgi:hypothetical protein
LGNFKLPEAIGRNLTSIHPSPPLLGYGRRIPLHLWNRRRNFGKKNKAIGINGSGLMEEGNSNTTHSGNREAILMFNRYVEVTYNPIRKLTRGDYRGVSWV